MSTTTLDTHGADAAELHKQEGFLDRVFNRFMAAQEARARRVVRQQLAAMSDTHLFDLGIDAAEIGRIRSNAGSQLPYWI